MLALVQDVFRRVPNEANDPTVRLSRSFVKGVAAGEGQYRLRSGRFRFRYDVDGLEVVLNGCGLRREGAC